MRQIKQKRAIIQAKNHENQKTKDNLAFEMKKNQRLRNEQFPLSPAEGAFPAAQSNQNILYQSNQESFQNLPGQQNIMP